MRFSSEPDEGEPLTLPSPARGEGRKAQSRSCQLQMRGSSPRMTWSREESRLFGRTSHLVTPTKVGVQLSTFERVKLDSGFRRNDE